MVFESFSNFYVVRLVSMLDPLTAVGLAGTVVQFVDFSTKLVSHSVELYEKGGRQELAADVCVIGLVGAVVHEVHMRRGPSLADHRQQGAQQESRVLVVAGNGDHHFQPGQSLRVGR